MATKDIGGGVLLPDIGSSVNSLINLKQLQASEANTALRQASLPGEMKKLELETQKLEAELPKIRAEGISAQQKLLGDIHDSAAFKAIKGDITGANEMLKNAGMPFEVLGKGSVQGSLRARNLSDNSEFDYDPFAQKRVETQITTDADIQKQRAAAGVDLGKRKSEYITTRAEKLISGRVVKNAQEAQAIAAQEFDNANQMAGSLIQSAAKQNAQAIAGLPERPGLGMDLRPKETVKDGDLKELTGFKTMNDIYLSNVLPKYVELQKRLPPNLANSTIEGIRKQLGDADPEFTFLTTMTGKALFEQIKEITGAAFPEAELVRYEKLFPNEKDNIKTAVGKITALSVINAAKAEDKLNILEAAGRDVTELRKELQVSHGDSNARAGTFLNALPAEIKGNKEVMRDILSVMPQSLRESIKQEVIRRAQSGGGQ